VSRAPRLASEGARDFGADTALGALNNEEGESRTDGQCSSTAHRHGLGSAPCQLRLSPPLSRMFLFLPLMLSHKTLVIVRLIRYKVSFLSIGPFSISLDTNLNLHVKISGHLTWVT
jgi:hypothetical protein